MTVDDLFYPLGPTVKKMIDWDLSQNPPIHRDLWDYVAIVEQSNKEMERQLYEVHGPNWREVLNEKLSKRSKEK